MTDTDRTFATSETGGRKETKQARFDQIPSPQLWELAEHYGKGNAKYPPAENGLDNWRNGYEWSLSYAAAQRHLNLFWSGEDIDKETGSKHLIAAAWHCFAMAFWMDNPELVKKFDNRQDKPCPQGLSVEELYERMVGNVRPQTSSVFVGNGDDWEYIGEATHVAFEPNDDLVSELDFPPGHADMEFLSINPEELADGHYGEV